MKHETLEPAYVLHRRPYRETSFLVDLFSEQHGRLTVLARGVRKTKSATQGLLQPFIPLLVSWRGKGELPTLTQIEQHGEIKKLQGDCLFAGFYLNELITALLPKWDAHNVLYQIYEKTLLALQSIPLEEKTLRAFEKHLLEDLGYGFLPKSNNELHHHFSSHLFYRFIPEVGFEVSDIGDPSDAKSNIFSGKSLIDIANEDWQDEKTLQDAKRLTRFVLSPLLGARPIFSRRLFLKPTEEKVNE